MNKKLQKAKQEHLLWLEQRGLAPKQLRATKRSRGRVIDFPDLTTASSTTQLSNTIGYGPKKDPKQYTGTLIKGISTMHKSNAVPIINDKQAKEIATMRRG